MTLSDSGVKCGPAGPRRSQTPLTCSCITVDSRSARNKDFNKMTLVKITGMSAFLIVKM